MNQYHDANIYDKHGIPVEPGDVLHTETRHDDE